MSLSTRLSRGALVLVAACTLAFGGCASDSSTNPAGNNGDTIAAARPGSRYVYGYTVLDRTGTVVPNSYFGDSSATIVFTGVGRDTVSSVTVSYDCTDSTYFAYRSDNSLVFSRDWGSSYDHVEGDAWITFPGTVGASRTDTILVVKAFLDKTVKATSKREADTTIVIAGESLDCRKYSTHLAIHYQGGSAYNDGTCDMAFYVSRKLGYVVREWCLRGGRNSSGNPYEGGHLKTLLTYNLK